jgi:site-specific recombinase XerD
MIAADIQSYPLDYYLCGIDGMPCEAPVSANYWSSIFTAVIRELGFDESYVLYSIKNTGAIKWYKAGIDMFAIQKQIGHQDPKTTQIYFKSIGVLDFAHVNAHVPAF